MGFYFRNLPDYHGGMCFRSLKLLCLLSNPSSPLSMYELIFIYFRVLLFFCFLS